MVIFYKLSSLQPSVGNPMSLIQSEDVILYSSSKSFSDKVIFSGKLSIKC